jgi:hypothetical protein
VKFKGDVDSERCAPARIPGRESAASQVRLRRSDRSPQGLRTHRFGGRLRLSFAALYLCTGCASSLPVPPRAVHTQDSFVDVPYPPPAALAETMPPRPNVAPVIWVDGDWKFRGNSYAWERGGWYETPNEAGYARSEVRYSPDGRILFAPGVWYSSKGEVLPKPNRIVPALTPPNELTSETMVSR